MCGYFVLLLVFYTASTPIGLIISRLTSSQLKFSGNSQLAPPDVEIVQVLLHHQLNNGSSAWCYPGGRSSTASRGSVLKGFTIVPMHLS